MQVHVNLRASIIHFKYNWMSTVPLLATFSHIDLKLLAKLVFIRSNLNSVFNFLWVKTVAEII